MSTARAVTILGGGTLRAMTLVLGILGCERRTADELSAYRGIVLPTPQPKAEFTLQATDGHQFDFRHETEGFVTLLFFGYTNCPDVCPIHLANIAAVLHKLAPAVASQIKVVFVSTDPERDTPQRIRQWLDQFDPAFIGLRGPLDHVNAIQQQLGLPAAVPERSEEQPYTVGHAAQVIAYTRDGLAHVVYPFGTRQVDWAHDLPKLVQETWGGERR